MTLLNGNDEQTNGFKRSATQAATAATEGALFRSMSMNMVSPAPLLHDELPRVFHKSHSYPFPPREDKPVSPAWVWKMNNPLSPPPLFHPLERTAATIEDLPLDTITARISGFMKDHSITCSYNDGCVECSTDDLLRFVVQLWQGSEPNKSSIVVEVQRRQGCCIRMQGLRNELVQVILNGQTSPQRSRPLWVTCKLLETMASTSSVPPPITPKNAPTALDICRNLLESERLDENRLGLESLCIITDPSKVCVTEADRVCQDILLDLSLQDLLQVFFVESGLGHNNMMDEDSGDEMAYEQGGFYECLHVLALKVLSHALESVTQKQSTIEQISINLSNIFWQTVLQALYYNLKTASYRPIEASLSIRCLRLLQILEPATSNLAPSHRRLHGYLLDAHHFGLGHSRSLEQESEMLMGRLGFVH